MRAQTADVPALGVNIAWGFVFTCPAGDPTCAPNVEYSALAAYAYTDAQGNRTRFADWVRNVALPSLRVSDLRTLRMFFSPGTDVGCTACGYTGAPIERRPYLLTRGTPYLSGRTYATRSQPYLHDWVFTNLELFFRDLADAGIQVDLVLDFDENYAYWSKGESEGEFVGFEPLYRAWEAAVAALVRSGAGILQVETRQELQLFQMGPEQHAASSERKRGWVPSRILPSRDYVVEPMGAAQAEMLDATLGPLHAKFPAIAKRIFPGLELRAGGGYCNTQTNNGWGDGPWPVTDINSYYRYVASRRAQYPAYPFLPEYPAQINFHRYVANDLHGNVDETADNIRRSFDDLYGFSAGDAAGAFTKCDGNWVSPVPWSTSPLVVFGESNSSAAATWEGLTILTGAFRQSRLEQWAGPGFSHSLLMPWYFGFGASPWDPENTKGALSGAGGQR